MSLSIGRKIGALFLCREICAVQERAASDTGLTLVHIDLLDELEDKCGIAYPGNLVSAVLCGDINDLIGFVVWIAFPLSLRSISFSYSSSFLYLSSSYFSHSLRLARISSIPEFLYASSV